MKFKRSIPYQISIDPTPNGGFICKVGCATLAYAGYTKLIRDLTEYFENPVDVEKQYNDDVSKLGRVHIGSAAPIFSSTGLTRMSDSMFAEQQGREEAKHQETVLTPNTDKENKL